MMSSLPQGGKRGPPNCGCPECVAYGAAADDSSEDDGQIPGLENDSDSDEQIPVRQFTLAESRALSDSGASLHMVPKPWSEGESLNGMKKQSCRGADGHFIALMKRLSW